MGLIHLLVFSLQVFAAEPVVPKLNVEFWNKGGIQSANNCYNYSTNRASGDYAQPGAASGEQYRSLNCDDVKAAAAKDLGLTPTSFYNFKEKKDGTLIALVVWPGRDFHWYRRDDNGMWSHKMGWMPAANVDDSGKKIEDPEKADRGGYKDFCGYFKIESYPKDESEQDAGRVRIGRMKALPDLPAEKEKEPTPPEKTMPASESYVEVNIYSGRPNPKIPLREVLAKTQIRNLVQDFQVQASRTSVQGLMETDVVAQELAASSMKLGYRGLVIHDNEGLLYPSGTVLEIHGDKAKVESLFDQEPQYFRTNLIQKIERSVLTLPEL